MRRFFLGLLMLPLAVSAQDAVVLNDETNIKIASDMRGYTASYTVSYLVNNEKGADIVDFVDHFDKERHLTSFEGTVTSGNFSRKLKKSELKRTEYSSNLAVDGYTLYYEITPPSYPAIVTYSYSVNVDDEMISLPPFAPIPSYNVAVAHGSWTMDCPKEFKYKYAIMGEGISHSVTDGDKDNVILKFTCDSLKALTQEPFGRSLSERIPSAFVSPDTIIFHGTSGSMQSWHDLGAWLNDLAMNRQTLPSDAIAAVHAAADTCKTTVGKVVALKKLMGSRTHYVSIQLGIGGYQPETASRTWQLGYGDCKGLSNLMKAMLHEVGIESNLVAINYGSRFFVKSLPSLQFTDHMILDVPLGNDTLWLECTSDKVPVGYVHDDIAGHTALEFNDNGGKLVTLPDYADSVNANYVTSDIKLNADGSAHVVIDDEARCHYYDHEVSLLTLDHDKLVKAVNGSYNLTGANVNNVSVTDNTVPPAVPSLTLHTDANCRYARVAGRRMFVSIDPEGGSRSPDIQDSRTEDFYIRNGRKTVTTTTIHIPEGFDVEAMPRSMTVNEPCGSFSIKATKKDSPSGNSSSAITIVKTFLLRNGVYPKSSTAAFRNLYKQCKTIGSSKIVLVKK